VIIVLTAARLREVLGYDPATGVFRWRIKPCPQMAAGDVAGTAHNAGYVSIRVLGKVYLAHRLAWLYMSGEWPAGPIDHRNCDRADNSWGNLRASTKSTNAANSKAHRDSASGVKGVYWSKAEVCWRSEICVRGRRISVGLFDSIEEAAAAYKARAEEFFGEFARAT
jgi:hypothetical protein